MKGPLLKVPPLYPHSHKNNLTSAEPPIFPFPLSSPPFTVFLSRYAYSDSAFLPPLLCLVALVANRESHPRQTVFLFIHTELRGSCSLSSKALRHSPDRNGNERYRFLRPRGQVCLRRNSPSTRLCRRHHYLRQHLDCSVDPACRLCGVRSVYVTDSYSRHHNEHVELTDLFSSQLHLEQRLHCRSCLEDAFHWPILAIHGP